MYMYIKHPIQDTHKIKQSNTYCVYNMKQMNQLIQLHATPNTKWMNLKHNDYMFTRLVTTNYLSSLGQCQGVVGPTGDPFHHHLTS